MSGEIGGEKRDVFVSMKADKSGYVNLRAMDRLLWLSIETMRRGEEGQVWASLQLDLPESMELYSELGAAIAYMVRRATVAEMVEEVQHDEND